MYKESKITGENKIRINSMDDIAELNSLSDEEIKDLLEMIDAELASAMNDSYLSFLRESHDGFVVGKHTQYLTHKLEEFMAGDKKFLVISMPPQHGKSLTVTESFPAWYVMKNPKKRVILTAYNSDFATDFGRKNKDKIERFGHHFNVSLNPLAKRNDKMFINGYGGSIMCFGIMSGITGKGADLIIIDDPIKNRQEANSKTTRESVWDEILDSVNTRLSADGKIIFIMTRWHEDDPVGRIIDIVPEQCEIINIPLEADEDDPLGREVGEPLFPEIGKDAKWLEETKRMYTQKKGKLSWEALYNGKPSIAEGNLLKAEHFNYYKKEDLPEKFPVLILSVDTALKDGEDNDWTVIQAWGKIGPDFYMLDITRGHWNFTQMVSNIRMMHNHWKPQQTLIEAKAAGQPVIDVLRRTITGIIPVVPKDGKVSRTQAILGAVEGGNIYIPEDHLLTYDFVEECKSFPNGKNDDMVDAFTQAVYRLMYQTAELARPKPKPDPFGRILHKEPDQNVYGIGDIGGFMKW